ncbi:hypothetical protein [Flavobacterium sp.]|uniref:hypothetical protein n=2 Tax=Flavobacterium sp. TaxID=239 RepID=UPI00404722DF
MKLNFGIKDFFFQKRNYYLSRYYYKQQIDNYSYSLSYYSKILNSTCELNYLQSSKAFFSENAISFNANMKSIEKQYGKPIFTVKNEIDNRIVIQFYRIRITNQSVKCEFHYYENKLFYIKYIFSYLTNDNRKLILKTIENKYLNDNPLNFEKDIIVDEFNNTLLVTENSHFNVEYLTKNNDFFHKFKELKERYDNRKIREKEEFARKIRTQL